MDESIKLRIRYWSRQPKAILMLTGSILVILNGIFFAWQTLPGYLHRTEVRDELVALERQLKHLSLQPNPQRVSDAAVAELLNEVPTNTEASDVLSTLLDFSAEAEVWISLFKQANDTASADPLEQQINELSGSEAAGTELESPVTAPEQGSPFHEESYEITINGSLAKLLNFFDLLASNSTVTNIDTWALAEMAESDAQKMPELADKRGNYTLTLTFSMYSMPAYTSIFGSERTENTSVQEMLKQLQSRYPGIKKFESITSGEGGN